MTDCEHEYIDFEGRNTLPKTQDDPCGVCPDCGFREHVLSVEEANTCGRCGAGWTISPNPITLEELRKKTSQRMMVDPKFAERVWAAEAARMGWPDPKLLDVHHLTYARLGAEDPDDLIPVCRRHHQLIHRGQGDGMSSEEFELLLRLARKALSTIGYTNVGSDRRWYREVYLKSEHWMVAAEAARVRASYRCEFCVETTNKKSDDPTGGD